MLPLNKGFAFLAKMAPRKNFYLHREQSFSASLKTKCVCTVDALCFCRPATVSCTFLFACDTSSMAASSTRRCAFSQVIIQLLNHNQKHFIARYNN